MTSSEEIVEILRTLLARHRRSVPELSSDLPLYAEGLGLDSMQAAELSAMLEDRFGDDPYTAGVVPQTLGDLVAYYERER